MLKILALGRALQTSRPNQFNRAAFFLLILLAAALRFYHLDAQDIWGDEAFSIFLSQQPLSAVIAGAADTHPPFYPLLLFFWMKLVGNSAFATRALSALIGVLVVPLVFVLAKCFRTPTPSVSLRAVFAKQSHRANSEIASSQSALLAMTHTRIAWFAAILSAVSPLLIYYSQETRMYELVTVLSLASVYFTLRYVQASARASERAGKGAREKNHSLSSSFPRSLVPLFLITTALAIYTHYSAIYVLLAENIFVAMMWLRHRMALQRWVLMQLALVAAYAPWIVVQTQFLQGKASARFDEWGWRGIKMIFGKTALAFSGSLALEFPLAQIAALLFVGLLLLGVYAIARERDDSLWFGSLYVAVPIFIAWLVNPILPFFFERYVLVALPGFYLAAAFGLDYIARYNMGAAVSVMLVLVGISLFSLSNYFYNDAYTKGKYGQMMTYVKSHAQRGDALILNNPLQKPLYFYYAPHEMPAYFLPDGAPLEDPRTRQQLEDIAKKHSRLWLVMFGNPAEYDPTGYLPRWFGANAFKSFSRGFADASLTLYDMPSAEMAVKQSTHMSLGENIQLVGYELDRAEISPGQTLQLTLHWQTTARIVKPYKVFTHLIGAAERPATQSPVWAQMDGEPVGDSRPTTQWQTGETIDDRYGLQVPTNAPPGEYSIEVGMYDPVTLIRLPVRDEKGNRVAEDRVVLGTVRVR